MEGVARWGRRGILKVRQAAFLRSAMQQTDFYRENTSGARGEHSPVFMRWDYRC